MSTQYASSQWNGPTWSPQNPLDMVVTEPQRERSLDYLHQAYAESRITREDHERRVGIVLQARTRREMNRAFDGLARIPLVSTPTPFPVSGGPTAPGRALAAVTHFSGLGTFVFGPVLAYAVAPRGSYLRREAAKAFNFQLLSLVAFMALSMTGVGHGVLAALGGMLWMLLTIVGGAKAAAGQDWRNPVTRVVPLRLLDEGPRRPAALGR